LNKTKKNWKIKYKLLLLQKPTTETTVVPPFYVKNRKIKEDFAKEETAVLVIICLSGAKDNVLSEGFILCTH